MADSIVIASNLHFCVIPRGNSSYQEKYSLD